MAGKKLNTTQLEQAINSTNSKARGIARKRTEEKEKGKGRYLSLDLKPGGEDLKSYVVERAGDLSKEEGVPVSTTNVIQRLIRQDKKAHGGSSTDKVRQHIIDMLMKVPDADLKTLESVIKKFV